MALNTYINDRLNLWAIWSLQRSSGTLGFPRECSYTRLAARGGGGFMSPDFNEEAWLVEKAVQSLPDYLRHSVRVFYLEIGTIEQKAQDLHCNKRMLYRHIDRAHGEIMEWLNDEACGVHAITRNKIAQHA